MTMDKSLRLQRGLIRSRSVLTRAERIERLQGAERWQEGDSPFGLAKVRVYKMALKKKKKKGPEDADAAEGDVDKDKQASQDPRQLHGQYEQDRCRHQHDDRDYASEPEAPPRRAVDTQPRALDRDREQKSPGHQHPGEGERQDQYHAEDGDNFSHGACLLSSRG